MAIYTSLAAYYDRIFTLSENEKKFHSGIRSLPGQRCLDVGCGTGQLSYFLHSRGALVTGVDTDPEMIRQALSKGGGPSFRVASMTELTGVFGRGSFDLVYCCGNTLAHLPGVPGLDTVLRQVRTVTLGTGRFVIQILNYDRIMSASVSELEPIRNAGLTFQRRYAPSPGEGRLVFSTELRGPDGLILAEGSTLLYPFMRSEIEQSAERTGWRVAEIFGGFDRSAWSLTSALSVCVLEPVKEE